MIVNQWVEHYLITLALKAVYNRITGLNQIVEHIFDIVQPRVFSRKFQSSLPTIILVGVGGRGEAERGLFRALTLLDVRGVSVGVS